MRLPQACDKVIEYSFYLLFFFVPIIMTPFNYELFEFNKMLLVYFLTTIIVSTWLIKMIIHKKFIFRRSFMDIPLLIFLISQFLSFFFSIDRHTSLWGYYSRFHGGLLSTIAYLLFYWAFVSNMDRRKTQYAIRCMLISAAFVSAYGIAEHFGIDAQYWVQDVKNRVFSSLGQPNWLAAYLVALLPIPMAMILNFQVPNTNDQINLKRQKPMTKLFGKLKNWLLFVNWHLIIGYLLMAIFYLCLLYTKSRSGFLGFGISYIVFWGLIFLKTRLTPKNARLSEIQAYAQNCVKNLLVTSLIIGLITLWVGSPWMPNLGQLIQKSPPPPVAEEPSPIPVGGTESGEIRKIVWKGAIEVWKHWPIFGSGVETFAYSYYSFRPREHNDVSEWDFLYNKAHNEYLNFAATTGTVGLLAYLGVIGTFIGWSLIKFKNQKLKSKITNKNSKFSILSCHFNIYTLPFALLAGYTSILITNFFGFSVVAVALLFFLYPAIAVVLVSKQPSASRKQKIKKLASWQKSSIAIIALVGGYCLLSVLRLWYADFIFAKGEKFNNAKEYDSAFNYLQQAVMLRPSEPFYHDQLALSVAHLATLAFEQDQATLSAELTELAISESDQVLKTNPYHLNFWKNRTRVFYTLADIDEKYNQNALESLLVASVLAPTDAKVFYNLGLIYAQVGQDETAIETLEKTVELKPNYHEARYALALFYEEKGDLKEARHQLEYILEKINPQDEVIKERLESL